MDRSCSHFINFCQDVYNNLCYNKCYKLNFIFGGTKMNIDKLKEKQKANLERNKKLNEMIKIVEKKSKIKTGQKFMQLVCENNIDNGKLYAILCDEKFKVKLVEHINQILKEKELINTIENSSKDINY